MMNKIFQGDCLEVLKNVPDSSVDLIYLDPPFLTKKKHTSSNRTGEKLYSFDDVWAKNYDYFDFIVQRLVALKPKLKDTGSIFVHCDKSGEHYVRAALDHVFGEKNFRSEIIWSYKRWSNSRKGLLPTHQNIYYYTKTSKFKFNVIHQNYSDTTNVDQILQARTRDSRNKSVYQKDNSGNVKLNAEKKGVPLGDVWDIPYLNPKAAERTGYPTQKPILLLEKILEISSDVNDTVLDPFCGSGTTCVAAKLNNRNYIGIDISQEAVELTQSRLENPVKTESALLTRGREAYQNNKVDLEKHLSGLEYNVVQRNRGIDAILKKTFQGGPVLVRVQRANEDLSDAFTALKKAVATKKSSKSFLIQVSSTCELLPPKDDVILIIPSPRLQIQDSLYTEPI